MIKPFSNIKLRAKLITSFLIVSLVPLILFTIWNRYRTRDILLDRAQQGLLNNTQQTVNLLDQFVLQNLNTVRTQAQLPILVRYLSVPKDQRRSLNKEVENTFDTLVRRDILNIASYVLLDTQGIDILGTPTEDAGKSYREAPYFKRPLETGLPSISDVLYSQEEAGPIVYFSAPVRDKDNQTIGVLLLRYRALILQNIVSRSHPDELALLLDRDRRRLAQNDDTSLVLQPIMAVSKDKIEALKHSHQLSSDFSFSQLSPIAPLEEALQKKDGSPFFQFEYQDKIQSSVVLSLDQAQWSLVVSKPQSVFLAPIETQLRGTILFAMVSAIAVSAAAIALGYTLSQPISNLMVTVKQFSEGNLGARSSVTSQDELGELAISFNEMAGQMGQLLTRLERRSLELEMSQSTTLAMGELARAIFDRNRLLQGAAQLMLEQFKLQGVYVYLWDEEADNLVLSQTLAAVDKDSSDRNSSDRESSDAGELIASSPDGEIKPWVAAAVQRRQVSVQDAGIAAIAIPMISNNQLVGVLELQDSLRSQFTDAERETFQTVTNQIAIAWNNAKLIEDIQVAREKSRQQAQFLTTTLQELRSTQSQLIQTEKMSGLGQLMAGIAHEINNPISFIHGNLSHAEDYVKDFTRVLKAFRDRYPDTSVIDEIIGEEDFEFLLEDSPKLIKSMKVGTDRIRGIILSLRNFSRLDEAEYKDVDIHEGLDSTLLILQHRLKANSERGKISVIKQYQVLPKVDCFPSQLNQVFMNILVNSIDALDANLDQIPDPTITIETQFLPSHHQVGITIRDNGPGIPEDIRQKIFEPFFTTKPIGKGTGLGMSISYQIVTEKHRGILRCNSYPNQGACFEIVLPVQHLKDPTQAQESKGQSSSLTALVSDAKGTDQSD